MKWVRVCEGNFGKGFVWSRGRSLCAARVSCGNFVEYRSVSVSLHQVHKVPQIYTRREVSEGGGWVSEW